MEDPKEIAKRIVEVVNHYTRGVFDDKYKDQAAIEEVEAIIATVQAEARDFEMNRIANIVTSDLRKSWADGRSKPISNHITRTTETAGRG